MGIVLDAGNNADKNLSLWILNINLWKLKKEDRSMA